MKTIENNKLFAEFMAKRGDWRAQYLLGGGFGVRVSARYGDYHKSWNWLMPVVSKINKIHSNKMIPDPAGINAFMIHFKLRNAVANCDITETYSLVVEYIKNENDTL